MLYDWLDAFGWQVKTPRDLSPGKYSAFNKALLRSLFLGILRETVASPKRNRSFSIQLAHLTFDFFSVRSFSNWIHSLNQTSFQYDWASFTVILQNWRRSFEATPSPKASKLFHKMKSYSPTDHRAAVAAITESVKGFHERGEGFRFTVTRQTQHNTYYSTAPRSLTPQNSLIFFQWLAP